MRMQDASQGGHLDFGLEFWFPDFCQKAPRGPIWTLDVGERESVTPGVG